MDGKDAAFGPALSQNSTLLWMECKKGHQSCYFLEDIVSKEEQRI